TTGGTWQAPENAHFVRIVGLSENWGALVQLNAGETLLPYEPYYAKMPFETINGVSIPPEMTTFFYKSSNLFDKSKAVDGSMISTAGEVVAHSNYCVSDFIPLNSPSYTVTGTQRLSYYDKDKVYISRNDT